MQHFHKILYVSLGSTDEGEGLKQAISLARNNKAPLKVLVTCPDLPSDLAIYKIKFQQYLLDQANASIRSICEILKLERNDVAIDVDLLIGEQPANLIIQEVLRDGYDLLVKEAETHKRGKGFMAIDMALLRKCPCPVWLSRPILHSRGDIRVALAIDPEFDEPEAEALALRMLQLSRSLADSCSGELQILSCWEYEFEDYLRNNPWSPMDENAIATAVFKTRKRHEKALHGLLEQSGISDRQSIHHLRGQPGTLIPQFVEENGIEILVMGTVARTGISGFLIGNTAENIIQELSCSLVALKPPGFVSPVKAY